MKTDSALVFLTLIASVSFAQGEKEEIIKGPSDEFRNSLAANSAIPNVDLPAHILAEEGALTFYADFENPEEGYIPVYLVNRTEAKKSFSAQDHDIYMRLEFQREDGQWIRAQTHRNSWCGNSYYPIELPTGRHYKIAGYYPKGGKKAKVRYRSRSADLVSNTGDGFYLEADVLAASYDDMAAEEINGTLGWMLRAEKHLPFDFERTPADYLVALELLAVYSESLYYRKEAEEMADQLGEKSADARKIEKVLSREWPQPTSIDDGTLVRLCLKKIDSGATHFLYWELIADELKLWGGGERELPRELLAEVTRILPAGLQSENEAVVKSASKIFGSNLFINEFIGTQFLKDWLLSKNKYVSLAAATHLAKRGDFETLVSFGSEKAAKPQKYKIFGLLASEGREYGTNFYPRRPSGEKEREFWRSCLEEDPILAVASLPKTSEIYNRYNRFVQGPLKKYLENYVTTMGTDSRESEDLYPMSNLVRFFGTWQMEENMPVLKALLDHPEYTEYEASSSEEGRYLYRDYRVRRYARDALFKMKIAVDPDILLDEKILLPDLPKDSGSLDGDPFEC